MSSIFELSHFSGGSSETSACGRKSSLGEWDSPNEYPTFEWNVKGLVRVDVETVHDPGVLGGLKFRWFDDVWCFGLN